MGVLQGLELGDEVVGQVKVFQLGEGESGQEFCAAEGVVFCRIGMGYLGIVGGDWARRLYTWRRWRISSCLTSIAKSIFKIGSNPGTKSQ